MYIAKRISFEAAHRLEDLPESKCFRMHGHSWVLEAKFFKRFNAEESMVVDFSDVSAMLKETIFDVVDHQYLNDVYKIRMPTSEALCHIFWQLIVDAIDNGWYDKFKGVGLTRVRLWETATAYAEYMGE